MCAADKLLFEDARKLAYDYEFEYKDKYYMINSNNIVKVNGKKSDRMVTFDTAIRNGLDINEEYIQRYRIG